MKKTVKHTGTAKNTKCIVVSFYFVYIITMKVVRLVGRLGNQMFIYAFAKAVEYYTGEKVLFDISFYETHPRDTLELENLFNIHLDTVSKELISNKFKASPFYRCKFINSHKRLFRFLLWDSVTSEKHYSKYQPDLLTLKGNIYYSGYFQCEKYFREIKDDIRKAFSFKPITESCLINKRKEIEQLKCPVFINVRRGDYVTLAQNNIVNWLCDMSYYQKAAKFMKEKYPDCTFIAVSDEPEWLEQNLKIGYPFKIYSSGTPYLDIYLLQACKHGICANSSYSWWAAWLIDNPQKTIIAPSPWVQPGRDVDIIPDDWIKMPRLG